MIRVKDLWKSYKRTFVLKGLDLEVHDGETLVILGRSGAGKSVLLRQIMGLEKPDRGSIFVGGVDMTKLEGPDLFDITLKMGMLFQASALFDSLTIFDNTAFYLRQHEDLKEKRFLSETEIEERVKWALGVVGLEGTQDLMPSDLSGGMRKRAGLARLIAYKPKILLYDEPTTGLDPITAMDINQLIMKTKHELAATSIVVTHDLVSAFHVADRIALHHEGKITHVATKEEFIKIQDPLVQSFLKNAQPEGVFHE